MAATKPLLLLSMSAVLVLFGVVSAAQPTVTTQSRSTGFIRSSCRATRYPSLCVRTLSPYARVIRHDAHSLARVALTLSLSSARSAMSHAAGLARARGIRRHEYLAVRDCIQTLSNGVGRLAQSIEELGRMRRWTTGPDFDWHMGNVETWVSSALTDDNTCLDGFRSRAMNGYVKAAMQKRVNHAARVTSNALALVNRLATMRRGVHGGED